MDTNDLLAGDSHLSFCAKRLPIPRHGKDLDTAVSPAMVSVVEHSGRVHPALASHVGATSSPPFSGRAVYKLR